MKINVKLLFILFAGLTLTCCEVGNDVNTETNDVSINENEETSYSINITSSDNISIQCNQTEAKPGDLVTFSINEPSYKQYVKVRIGGVLVNYTDIGGGLFTFVMKEGNAEIFVEGEPTISQYKVTFIYNIEGKNNDEVSVNEGSLVNEPQHYKDNKTGFTFVGWYTSSNYVESTIFSFDTPINSNITLYAKWNINQYTITFNTDGGSLISPITQDYGTTVVAPNDPTKQGHTFTGWDKVIPTTMPAENIVITAIWDVNSYQVIFNANGGSAIDSQTINYNSQVVMPNDPSKTGYYFAGWYKDNDTFLDPWDFEQDVVTSNLTLYAKWTNKAYTVSFNSNGGNAIANAEANYGDTIPSPINPTKTGYSFAGWYKDNGTFLDPWDFEQDVVTSNLTLYAKWNINQYTITFNTNGGSSISPITQDYGTTVVAPNDPSKTGYSFNGWDKTIPTKIPAENVTINALWSINQYTITFETNGGTAIAPITQDYGTPVVVPNDPIKDGYEFEGWYLNSDLSGDQYNFTVMPNKNITLYAKWNHLDSNILVNSPSNGAWIDLRNDQVSDFLDNYEVGYSAKYEEGADRLANEYLVLSWEVTGSRTYDYYIIDLSTDPSFKEYTSYIATNNYLALKNLFTDTTYYWQIKGVKDGTTYICKDVFEFEIANYPRLLDVDGVSNLRDIGGVYTVDGKYVKEGIIYRSEAYDDASASITNALCNELGVTNILDLRSTGEGGSTHSPIGNNVNVINIEFPEYGDISNDSNFDSIKAAFDSLAQMDGAVSVVCDNGFDRTGTFMMLLEGALGYNQVDMYIDYELSNFSKYASEETIMVRVSNVSEMINYLRQYGSSEDTFSTCIVNYLTTGYGDHAGVGISMDTINTIRNKMLEVR